MRLIAKPITVYLTAAFLSLILSAYIGMHIDVINPDAICYLQSAKAVQQGLHTAMHLCPQAQWPFYSVLIYLSAKVSHLGFTESAYTLNSLFSLLSVLAFIAIIHFFTSQPRILWLAALVILLAHEFNALKQDIIRDHGFMACYLLSIWLLFNYFKQPSWRYALGWSLSLIAATLFRIEGAVFLLSLPFLTWFDFRVAFSARIKSFFQLNSVTLVIMALLSVWLLSHPAQDLTRINELHYQLLHGAEDAWHNFVFRTDILAKNVLTADSIRDARLIFVLTMLSWYVIQIIITLSLIYALLVIYAWWKRVLPEKRMANVVLWGYIVINLVITLAFVAEHLFLSKRYLMALSLVLMIWVPMALNQLLTQWRQHQWLTISVVLLMLLSAFGGISHFGYSKAYIREAGDWLAKNVPPQATLYSNDYQLMYYSNHFGNTIFTKIWEFTNPKVINWRKYDYLAIRINQSEPATSEWINQQVRLSPIKEFVNKRGDEVAIYRVRS